MTEHMWTKPCIGRNPKFPEGMWRQSACYVKSTAFQLLFFSFSDHGMHYIQGLSWLENIHHRFIQDIFKIKKHPQTMATSGFGRQLTSHQIKQGTMSEPLQFTQLSPNIQTCISNILGKEVPMKFQSFGVKNCGKPRKEIFILANLKMHSYLSVKFYLWWPSDYLRLNQLREILYSFH